jgi:Mycoplasma protein of unknown function, DUF285
VPALDTSSGTDFEAMFQNCRALTAVPSLDTSNGTIFSNMFLDCDALTTVPALDTGSGTRFDNMLSNCGKLVTVPALDMSNGTYFDGIFFMSGALTSILIFGVRYSINVDWTQLDAAALNTFFTNLGVADNAAGQQVVNITSAVGAAGCDRTIATAKNWQVVG